MNILASVIFSHGWCVIWLNPGQSNEDKYMWLYSFPEQYSKNRDGTIRAAKRRCCSLMQSRWYLFWGSTKCWAGLSVVRMVNASARLQNSIIVVISVRDVKPRKARGPWHYPRCIWLHFHLRNTNGTFLLQRNKEEDSPLSLQWQNIKYLNGSWHLMQD